MVACAQWAITAAGGEASGSGGTLSYSCGIVAFTHHHQNNISLSQGVQLGFEIPQFYVNASNIEAYAFEVFPNPTGSNLTIKRDNRIQNIPEVYVFSQDGKFLLHDVLFDEFTNLSLSGFSNGNYLVAIANGGAVLKYFKIIKQL